MRSLMVLTVVLVGCSAPLPAYSPVNFRNDIAELIGGERYGDAVQFLNSADPIRQANHDRSGYYAVAEDLIVLPGVHPGVVYDRERDWEFPGTSDAIEHMGWQNAATEFATIYNQHRNGR
ncbi:MAG: hypothetical protein ACR2NU_06305 [Aeoliella sp.]